MSKNLDQLAIKQFEAEVHHQFTPYASDFQGLARYRSNVVGNQVQYPVMGYSMMNEQVIGQPIKPANGTRTPIVMTMKNYAIGDWTNIFQQQTVNFDEMREFSTVVAQAMKNRMMQLLIDALAASSGSIPAANKVAVDVSGAEANLTVAAIRAGSNALDNMGVPEEDRTLLTIPSGVHNLTKDPQASNSQYVTGEPMMKGGVGSGFYGIGNIVKIPDLPEGGLPGVGTDTRKVYLYAKQAVGIATGVWKDAEVQHYNLYAGDFVSGLLSANACVIDPRGIVEITVKNIL